MTGCTVGSIQIIDSVHRVADVDTDKDQNWQKKEGKVPHDPDARWGVKHNRKIKYERGEEVEQSEYFYGYNAHVSMNAESGLITSLEVTYREAYDGHHYCSLVDHDAEHNLPVNTYAGNKGYDDGTNHFYLEYRGLHSANHMK